MKRPTPKQTQEAGFTLLETTIALVLMLIVALGAASLFSFSVYNNSAGSDRANALAIAQQTLEVLRGAKFNTSTVAATLDGGSYAPIAVIQDGRRFTVTKIIDDDPSTNSVTINPATNLKSITITVRPDSIGRGWAFGGGGTITLITQRSRSDL
jgi:prepilin-type N-terminal cleavage/methylation domain-containing protein